MKIIINEAQEMLMRKHFLTEAAKETFSTEELTNLTTFKSRVAYCREHLGVQNSSGSARMVFQIDDSKVLKLAKNEKGIAQNEAEIDFCSYSSVTPTVYENSSDYSWMIVDFALPAKKSDFEHVLGITFDEFTDFVLMSYSNYARNRWMMRSNMTKERYIELLENNEWLCGLSNDMGDYGLPYGDLIRISSYGIINVNGETELCLIDSGLNNDVANKYYS